MAGLIQSAALGRFFMQTAKKRTQVCGHHTFAFLLKFDVFVEEGRVYPERCGCVRLVGMALL